MALRLPLSLTLLVILTVFSLSLYTPASAFANSWKQPFQFSCPRGRVIRRVSGNRSNTQKDRRWNFACGPAPNNGMPTRCVLSSSPNAYRAPVSYRCPRQYVLTGVQSVYSNLMQDRRWRFKCCKQTGYVTGNCRWTYYRNMVGRSFSYRVPVNKVVTGWGSVYSAQTRDRRHKFYECTYRRPSQG